MNLSPKKHQQTCSEYLAATVLSLFPMSQILGTHVGQMGFSCDFSTAQPLSEAFLPDLEQNMLTLIKTMIKNNEEITQMEMMRENAASLLDHIDQPYLADLVLDAPSNIVPIIKIGQFHNWCPHPILTNPTEIGAVRLTSLEKLADHYRVEGFCTPDKQSAKEQVKLLKLAHSRDHLFLGKKLHLFELGKEGWFWHPKGERARQSLRRWWEDTHQSQGFSLIATPGRPTHHSDWFKTHPRRAVDFPLKVCEMVQVEPPFSNDKGLFGAGFYHRDLATTFCTEEQFQEIFNSSLQFILKLVNIYNLKCRWIEFQQGRKYSSVMQEVLSSHGITVEQASHEEKLNGPGVEARFIDSLGREWEGPQIIVDLTHPKELVLAYLGDHDEAKKPVCVTHSLFRSLERFLAMIVEHTEGVFPLQLLRGERDEN